MRRRKFITLAGGVAIAWPLAARAQQPTMRAIGILDTRASDGMASRLGGFRQGLKEAEYVEGENVTIAYRWAQNRIDRLPELTSELIRRQVAVIVTGGGNPSVLAAKAATTTIPIVFLVGEDPTKLGLVASLARPGNNLTGVNLFNTELAAKRLELLRELVPRATRIAVLVNPSEASSTETTLRDVETAARALGVQIHVFNADTSREIDTAFEKIGRERPDALFIGSSAFLNSRPFQLARLSAFHRLPATYAARESAEAGGLMSYASSIVDAYRQMGVYTGRILKGAKPGDLPVVQASKFELIINTGTARMLGLTVPEKLLALADEVIE